MYGPRPLAHLPSRRTRTLLLAALAAAHLCGLPVTAAPAPEWPAITQTSKPWTRWWWQGSIVSNSELTAAMEQYKAAGLGGLELTPIYGVRGQEERFIPYLSPAWVKAFEHTLIEGRRLGLGIDANCGTGWPFGGPQVTPAHASRYLAHKTFTLSPGSRLGVPVRLQQEPLVRYASRLKTPLAALKNPISTNEDPQQLAIDQARFPVDLPLVALYAYGPDGTCINLTSKVSSDRFLDWVAPDLPKSGWKLIALFQGWHGKQVERSAPGGEGDALDHFSAEALDAYLARFNQALSGFDLSGLRAWFNDSYEVDDAAGCANFTPRFLEEFSRRRGYELSDHLPLLLEQPEHETSRRVLADYRETLSDLLLERFTHPWRRWAAARGQVIRNQAHGSPANILDLYMASDIPEQEGDDLLSFKLAASAAHFKGTNLVAAEAGTWLNEHFCGTLGELRSVVDGFLLGGVNHTVYHGTAFSPRSEPWPGFQFYASMELNPANPIWRDLPELNAYVARAQSFLQAGRSDEDLALYYNIHDSWATRRTPADKQPHYYGRDGEDMSAFRDAAAQLMDAGFGFDAVSDKMIRELTVRDGILESRAGTRYRALVLPETRLLPLPTLAHIAHLVREGATLLVHKSPPVDVPGQGNLAKRRAEFRTLTSELFSSTRLASTRGRVLTGPSLPSLASRCDLASEELPALGLQYVRRRLPEGAAYFLANKSGAPFQRWTRLARLDANPTLFDPISGAILRPPSRQASAGGMEVLLQIPAGGTLIIADLKEAAEQPARLWLAGSPQPLGATKWTVSFLEGGPVLPPPEVRRTAGPWSEFGNADFARFSGTARYTTQFPRPRLLAGARVDAWRLELGEVHSSARVKLNGKTMATLFCAPWSVDIPADQLSDNNTLEIEVTSTAANRIADLDRRDPSWKRFYNVNMAAHLRTNLGADGVFSAAAWKTQPAGLAADPVLRPLSERKP